MFERRFSTYPADQSARAQRPVAPARWWQSPAFLLWLQELRIEPGVRYMQSTVLLLDIFLWGTNIVLWLQNIPAIVMVCGCRCVAPCPRQPPPASPTTNPLSWKPNSPIRSRTIIKAHSGLSCNVDEQLLLF